ncbi:MAG: hypothetical protein L6300_05695, partial [Syntrophaceae bacterium]|nr:hypothetical protein [Syntrophaceae bacterium]
FFILIFIFSFLFLIFADFKRENVVLKLNQNISIIISTMLIFASDHFLLTFLGLVLLLICNLKLNKVLIFVILILSFSLVALYGAFGTLYFSVLGDFSVKSMGGVHGLYVYLALALIVSFSLWLAGLLPFSFKKDSQDIFCKTLYLISAAAIFIKLGGIKLLHSGNIYSNLIFVSCIATITWGNIVALSKDDIKSWGYYIVLTQVGFLVIPLGLYGVDASSSLDIFTQGMIHFTFSIIGLMIILNEIEMGIGKLIPDLAGLYRRSLPLSVALVVFLMNMAGMPLTWGYILRFNLLSAILKANLMWVVILLAVNIVLLVANILRIFHVVSLAEDVDKEKIEVGYKTFSVALFIILVFIYFGIFPDSLLSLIDNSLK